MASLGGGGGAVGGDKPWLLTYNRRIRHLQGITIRNLSFTPSSNRPRQKAADDEALPNTLHSPGKLIAQRENKKPEQSRSSTNLQAIDTSQPSAKDTGDNHGESPETPSRKLLRMRRRSTFDWSDAGADLRRRNLNDVIRSRMADTFFSIHVDGVEAPIYVSEVIEKAMNPNFRFFDLNSWGPAITRLEELTVKVWAKNEALVDYQYLIELTVNLRSLQFIGKGLENFRHPLPENCILFHLTDGIYTSFFDVTTQAPLLPFAPPTARSSSYRVQHTSSYDALMKLSTLDDCIQDAIATRERITTDIENLLDEHRDGMQAVTQVPEARERLHTVESAVAAQKKRLEAAQRKRDELQASIESRREQMRNGRQAQERTQEDLVGAREKLEQSKEESQKVSDEIIRQRRRVCEELQTIYPIEPVLGKSLSFTIRGLPLPNSEFDDVNENEVAAALGHVAHVVNLMSFYLEVALPYPVQPRSSNSLINDPISMTTGPRTYPLFLKGTVRYRFEYGVFLLNKDIEVLCNWLGLKVLDVRQTLPNLKYLLYIATAGKGELPARKAGGIRGLLRHSRGTSIASPPESVGSDASGVRDIRKRAGPDGRVDADQATTQTLPIRSATNGKLPVQATTLPTAAWHKIKAKDGS